MKYDHSKIILITIVIMRIMVLILLNICIYNDLHFFEEDFLSGTYLSHIRFYELKCLSSIYFQQESGCTIKFFMTFCDTMSILYLSFIRH